MDGVEKRLVVELVLVGVRLGEARDRAVERVAPVEVGGDLFRRHDIGGGAKALWMFFVIILPYLGVFIYLIAESRGMAERKLARDRESQRKFDGYVQSAAAGSGGGSAAEIEKAPSSTR